MSILILGVSQTVSLAVLCTTSLVNERRKAYSRAYTDTSTFTSTSIAHHITWTMEQALNTHTTDKSRDREAGMSRAQNISRGGKIPMWDEVRGARTALDHTHTPSSECSCTYSYNLQTPWVVTGMLGESTIWTHTITTKNCCFRFFCLICHCWCLKITTERWGICMWIRKCKDANFLVFKARTKTFDNCFVHLKKHQIKLWVSYANVCRAAV